MFKIILTIPIKTTSVLNSRTILHRQFIMQMGAHYYETFDLLSNNGEPPKGRVELEYRTESKKSEKRFMFLDRAKVEYILRPADKQVNKMAVQLLEESDSES